MSILESGKIDYVGIRKDEVGLIISDHLDWNNETTHLSALQKKINAYLTYILDGQFEKQYPNEESKPFKIRVISESLYPEVGKKAIDDVQAFLTKEHPNISISQELLAENSNSDQK